METSTGMETTVYSLTSELGEGGDVSRLPGPANKKLAAFAASRVSGN
jgi:hypothetical protein